MQQEARPRPVDSDPSLGKRLLFTLVLVAGTLVVLELGLQIVWSPPPRFLGQKLARTGLFVRDTSFGWRMLPNQRLDFTSDWGDKTTITTNSAGFRDNEHEAAGMPGKPRVLLLGDSHAFGYGVDDNEVVSRRLDELLPNTEIIKLAVTGYNLAQNRSVLEAHGPVYSPDLVVMTFVQNDVTQQTIPDATPSQSDAATTVSASRRGIKLILYEKSRLYRLIVTRIDSNKSIARFLVRVGIKEQMGGYEQLDPNLRPSLKEYPATLAREWDETMREVERVDSLSRAMGASFMLVIVPAKQSIQYDELAQSLSHVDYSPEDFDLQKPYRALAQFCEIKGIALVDPRQQFQAALDSGRNPYFKWDMHMSAEGHQLLAEVLAPAINDALQ